MVEAGQQQPDDGDAAAGAGAVAGGQAATLERLRADAHEAAAALNAIGLAARSWREAPSAAAQQQAGGLLVRAAASLTELADAIQAEVEQVVTGQDTAGQDTAGRPPGGSAPRPQQGGDGGERGDGGGGG